VRGPGRVTCGAGKYARMRVSEDGERKEATVAWRTDVGLCAETTYAITVWDGD